MKKKKTRNGVDISSTYGMRTALEGATWLVVANRSGVQIFERVASSLLKVKEFENPKGKLKSSYLVADRPGRAFDSAGQSKTRHAMSTQESPAEHVATVLAQRVGKWLEKERGTNHFSRLVLIAEPNFLGRLKASLSAATRRLIRAEEEKNLAWLRAPALKTRLLTLTGGYA